MIRNTLALLALVVLASAWRPSWIPPLSDDTCGFSRADGLACLRAHVDANHDDRITSDELSVAIANYLPAYLRALSWFAGTDKALRDCDANGDGVLTPSDWNTVSATCMPTQATLCTLQWLCSRAEAAASQPK